MQVAFDQTDSALGHGVDLAGRREPLLAVAVGTVLAGAYLWDPINAPPFFLFAALACAWFALFALLGSLPDVAYDYLQTIGRAPLIILRILCALAMAMLLRYGHFSIAGFFVPVLLIVFRPSARQTAKQLPPAKKTD